MWLRDRCCVPGCYESRNSHKVLHGFPNPICDPQIFRSWVCAIGGDILGLDNLYIHKYCRVCHYHFEEKYLCCYNRISHNALPTLNLPGPLELPQLNSASAVSSTSRENGDTNEDNCPAQCIDDNYCPDTVAIEYEIACDSLNTSDLSNQETEDVSESDLAIDSSASQTNIKLGISYVSTHFNNKLLKNQPQCLTPQIITTQKVDIDTIQNLTKDEQIKSLKKQCRTLTAKLKRHQQRILCYKKQIKNEKNFTREKFDALTGRVPELGKRLMWMQLHQSEKKNGYRFDNKEKLMCLAIKKYKPECFKFLKKAFLMPCNKTLRKFVAKLQLSDSNIPEEEQNNEPKSDETESEDVISNTLDKEASEALISYEIHKGVIGELMQFNNSANLADFTDLEHGLC